MTVSEDKAKVKLLFKLGIVDEIEILHCILRRCKWEGSFMNCNACLNPSAYLKENENHRLIHTGHLVIGCNLVKHEKEDRYVFFGYTDEIDNRGKKNYHEVDV